MARSTPVVLPTVVNRNLSFGVTRKTPMPVADRSTLKQVKGRISPSGGIAGASYNPIEEDHDVIRAVHADAVRRRRRIVFANGGTSGPVRAREGIRRRVGVGSRGVYIGGIAVEDQRRRIPLWVKALRIDLLDDARLRGRSCVNR